MQLVIPLYVHRSAFPRLRDSPLDLGGESRNLGTVFSQSLYLNSVDVSVDVASGRRERVTQPRDIFLADLCTLTALMSKKYKVV